jgi:hypothetical protein
VTGNLTVLGTRPQAAQAQPHFHQWLQPNGTVWTLFYRTESGNYLLRFPELADFEVSRDGDRVSVWRMPDVSEGTVEHLYLNQVLPLALSRQGKLVLHASAVALGDVGIAFSGVSGRGKSTLAASFATAGARLLTDDGLQLSWVEDRCLVLPSHPSVRLWDDSERALLYGRAELSRPVDYTPKSRLLAGGAISYCDQPQPLACLYFLGDEDVPEPQIDRMSAMEALTELAGSTFLLDSGDRAVMAWHFEEMVKLSALPIFFRLNYPRRYEALARLHEAVIDHVRQITTELHKPLGTTVSGRTRQTVAASQQRE